MNKRRRFQAKRRRHVAVIIVKLQNYREQIRLLAARHPRAPQMVAANQEG